MAVRVQSVRVKKAKAVGWDDSDAKRPRVGRVFLSSTFQVRFIDRGLLVLTSSFRICNASAMRWSSGRSQS